jgi:hypothetical protein
MSSIKIFENRQVRSQWDAEHETWYFSVVDVVGVLTDSPNPRKYWSVLKTRLKKEGSELATNCSQQPRKYLARSNRKGLRKIVKLPSRVARLPAMPGRKLKPNPASPS